MAAAAQPDGSTARLVALLPRARRIAGGFVRRLPMSVRAEDVVAAATMGAWLAVLGRPELTGDAFRYYAHVRIRGAILDELRHQDWLPRSARSRDGPALWQGYLDELPQAQRRVALKTEPEQETDLLAHEASEALSRALASLPERERYIVVEVDLRERRQWDVGADLGISEPRVSQLRARALRRLRAALSG